MSNILSQDEVNALLRGVADGTTPVEGDEQETPGVRPCDLTSQERTLYGRMPGLDRIFDSFLRTLRGTMETLLGEIGGVTLAGIELVRYRSWLSRLAPPVNVNIFRLAPLHGNGLLVVSQPLASAALEVAFGGQSRRQTPVEGREYSGIETRVLQRFVARVLADFQDAWRPIQQLELSIVRSESNPAHAVVAMEDAVVLVAELRVLLEADEGLTLSIAIPYAARDPVRQKLTGEFETPDDERGASWASELRGRIGDVKLGIKAELGSCRMTLRQVMALGPGDVLTLEKKREEPIVMRIEKVPKFLGLPGVAGEGHAVRIVGWVRPERGVAEH